MARRNIAGLRGIVTGASSGIGRAIAAELVDQGARVVAIARRPDKLATLAQDLASRPGQIETLDGDVTVAAMRAAAVERAAVAFGGLDFLVNNAGIGAQGRFDAASPDRLRKLMEVNLFAAAEMIRVCIPALKSGRTPMIVNVSSVLGHRGIPHASEYCASKFALQGLSEALRAELKPLAIDLLVVSPGRTETEFFDQSIERGDYPWENMKGVLAEVVARRTVCAMRRGVHEVIPSVGGWAMVWINRLAPGLVDWYLGRYG